MHKQMHAKRFLPITSVEMERHHTRHRGGGKRCSARPNDKRKRVFHRLSQHNHANTLCSCGAQSINRVLDRLSRRHQLHETQHHPLFISDERKRRGSRGNDMSTILDQHILLLIRAQTSHIFVYKYEVQAHLMCTLYEQTEMHSDTDVVTSSFAFQIPILHIAGIAKF